MKVRTFPLIEQTRKDEVVKITALLEFTVAVNVILASPNTAVEGAVKLIVWI